MQNYYLVAAKINKNENIRPMVIFAALCIVGNFFISEIATLWLVSVIIFAVARVGQFYGHKIEGKKPSFFKDIQFLLIGPAWVLDNMFR